VSAPSKEWIIGNGGLLFSAGGRCRFQGQRPEGLRSGLTIQDPPTEEVLRSRMRVRYQIPKISQSSRRPQCDVFGTLVLSGDLSQKASQIVGRSRPSLLSQQHHRRPRCVFSLGKTSAG
jgi:hypothetical protein